MNAIDRVVPMNTRKLRTRLKLIMSRFGSLILLFQRMPVVQFLFPEANILGGGAMANSFSLAVTTVVGLGAYDSVAGQSQISQRAPLVVLGKVPSTSTATAATAINVPATVSAPLSFSFNWDPNDDFSSVKSWRCTTGGVVGTLPAGLGPVLNANSSTVAIGGNITISGTPTATPGIYPVTVRVYKNSNYGGEVAAQIFNICVLGFSTQPAATTAISSGGTATLNCAAAGNPAAIPIVGSGPPAAQPAGTLTYQWYQGPVGNTTTVAPGASTSPSYTTPALSTSTNYWVRIKSVLGTSIVTANSTAAAVNVTGDTTAPTVTINQAVAQVDPANAAPINFTVVFSEAVTNFATGDVTISGTAGGTKTATVTGSGTTYNVAVSGMTTAGTVVASLAGGVASDAAGNPSAASTSTDNTVSYDATAPTVTINQTVAQVDPTNASPINFTVVFSEAVTNFATGDVTISGTAGGTKAATVTGSGTTYNVAVSGMTTAGTVIASLASGVASDAAGNPSAASTSTDNTVNYDATAPTVTINQAVAQVDPTNTSPVNFTVVFSEAVANFATGDVTISGTAGGTKTATVTGSGTTYNVAVSGMTTAGTVMASLAGGVASDAVGNPSAASTSTDNTVNFDSTAPTVTINQTVAQVDPTNTSPINFTVVFSEAVANFATGDVTISGTAGGTKTATVTGSGTTYNVAVSGMTTAGTVIASLAGGVASDAAGNPSAASTSTDNTVNYDATALAVTIDQAVAQVDPTNASPINFTVVFSEPVANFATGDVTISGTAGGTKTATVTGSGTTYNVAVSGMTTAGTVVASLAGGVASNAVGNPSAASTSTDNIVNFDATAPTVTIDQAVAQVDPTNTSPINFTVVFSEAVANFTTGDVTISGTAGGTKTATVTGSGTTYNVAVSGMTTAGTVIASLASGVASDAAGNPSAASTSTDNTVNYDATAPTVTINQAVDQVDPTNTSPVNFTVVFSEAVANFTTGDVTISGTAGGTKTATVTGSGTTYNVTVSGMTTSGTVVASLAGGVASDAAGNPSAASTSVDNTVNFDSTAPTVTIDQAVAQVDPTNASPINFTVVFSDPVANFATGDVTISGTAGGTKTATVTGSGTTYNVVVSGMTSAGTVVASLAGGVASNAVGNPSAASTSADNTVNFDATAPTVTIDQAVAQVDPTSTSPINFTVVFSEAVANFATGDVTISGTAGGTKTATVTGSGTTYNVAVSGMTTAGTVVASLASGVASDAAGNPSAASTSIDNTVTYEIPVAASPEIAVEQPAGTNIADGGSKDFGPVTVGSSAPLTFTIGNTGNADLTGLTISKDGANAGDFTVSANPVAPVAGPSGTTTFTVTFTPSAAGSRGAAIHIANNDGNEAPFDINLTGTGTAPADPFAICFVGTLFEPKVGNRITLDLKRLLGPGETFKLNGKLPGGLSFNPSTGLISGLITGKPGIYQVSVRILQGKTVVRTINLPITVLPFPSALAGDYEAILEDGSGTPTGMFRISITPPNRWEATLEATGAKKREAKGECELAPGRPATQVSAVFSGSSGAPAVTVTLSIDGTTPNISGSSGIGALRGFRLANAADFLPSPANCTLVFDAGAQDGINVPAGLGWMKGRMGTTGTGVFNGMLGDATSVGVSLRLSPAGQAVIWAQPYSNKRSFVGGIVSLVNLGQAASTNEKLAESLWWSKAADAKTPSYPDGFPAMPISLGSSKWNVPSTALELGASLGWRGNRVASVTFEGPGFGDPDLQPPFVLSQEFTINDAFDLRLRGGDDDDDDDDEDSLSKVWTGRAVRTDGSFTGSIRIQSAAAGAIVEKSAPVTGVLVQDESWGVVTGCGLVKVPVGGNKGAFRTASVVIEQ